MVSPEGGVSSKDAKYSLPEILSVLLLVVQAAIPWTARFFLTQDGPSHLYTALATKELLIHPAGPFGRAYEFQHQITTNWSMIAILNLLAVLFTPAHAEQAMATGCILFGFFSFSYLIRSLNPSSRPISPTVNLLLNTWFLWVGFYNFYLGIALLACIVAYYIGNSTQLNGRRTILMSAGVLITFFTHVLPYALLIASVTLIAIWIHVVVPVALAETKQPLSHVLRSGWRPCALAGLALVPSLAIFGIFIYGALAGTTVESNYKWALEVFPMHIFASARGRIGEQSFLVPVMLFYCAVGLLSMRRREWATARGPVVIMAVASFVLYLFVPDTGFGGSLIKIRLLWPMFIFGSAVAYSTPGLRGLRTPLSIYISCFLIFTLIQAGQQNAQNVSRVAEVCKPIFDLIPPGANVLRLGYPTEATKKRFGIDTIPVDPLFHVEAWGAAQRGWVDLSDYQALSHIFPIREHRSFSTFRYPLWGLEGGTSSGSAALREILGNLPLTVDYVLVIGDGRAEDRSEILKELGSRMHLVATDPSSAFIWLYKNINGC